MEIITKHHKILVSKEDYETLNKFKWYTDKSNYACSIINKKHWKMHRYIMINIMGNN